MLKQLGAVRYGGWVRLGWKCCRNVPLLPSRREWRGPMRGTVIGYADAAGCLDRAAIAAFKHPGDVLDEREARARAPEAEAQRDGVELLMQLLIDMLPPKRYCGAPARRVRSVQIRVAAYLYRAAPGVFDGMTGEEIAASFGVCKRVWFKQLSYVDRIIRDRRFLQMGPSRRGWASEVPREAEPSL